MPEDIGSQAAGCPYCENGGVSQFNWKRPSKDILAGLPNIRFIQQLRCGKLFACAKCAGQWYLDEEARDMHFVFPECREAVGEWNRRRLVPGPGILDALQKIGASPRPLTGRAVPLIQIPCRCTVRDGKEIDFCLVTFQQMPPLGKEIRTLFIDEVVAVSESSYALPRLVRFAASRTRESGMDLLPVYARAPGGQYFDFSWCQEFFEKDDIRGRDLVLVKDAEYGKMTPERAEPYDNLPDGITYVIADWQPECEGLRFEMPDYLEALNRYGSGPGLLARLAEKFGLTPADAALIKMGIKTPSGRLAKRMIAYVEGRPANLREWLAGRLPFKKGPLRKKQ